MLATTLWLLSAILTLSAETIADEDRLTTAEENFVYSTKDPSQRVKAFLKVADAKVDQVRKDVRAGTSADIAGSFRGYTTAIEGAWMAVSWGQARKADVTESVRAIHRATKKHLETLQKLQATAAIPHREALSQMVSTLSRIQNVELSGLYAQR
jgi:hypothetical protein